VLLCSLNHVVVFNTLISPDENIPYETFQKVVIISVLYIRSASRLTLAVKVFFLIYVVLGLQSEGKIAIKL